jgi:predicted 2-oxoglutarate/Fe(II)-dependent dioxygenase YbiX
MQKTNSIGSISNVHVIEDFISCDVLSKWQTYASRAKYSRGAFTSHANSSSLYNLDEHVKEIEDTASYVFGIPLNRYDGNGLLNKWSAGDSLVKHVDAPTDFEQFVGKNIKDPPSAILYSSIVYLNDDYKGGDIHFTGHNVTISPTAGSLLLFPATTMYPHEVREITLGNRYTFTLFLSNPDIMNMFRRLFSIAEQAHNEKRNDEK